MKPDLSIIIVNYNTCELLRACLASLVPEPMNLEIIVVDNASRDGSVEMVRDEFPQVKLLAQPRNTWYCGGNNIGLAAASADYVLLLNPDTVVKADTLPRMLAWLQENPGYAGVTARLVYPDGSTQRTCSRVPTLAYLLAANTILGLLLLPWRHRLQRHHWYHDWDRTTDQDVEVIPGSCTLMPHGNRLDDRLLLYFPEDDLAQRLRLPFRYLADCVIEHHEKAATQSWLATRIYFRDLLTYAHIHHGVLAMMLLWIFSRPLLLAMWLKRRLAAQRPQPAADS